MKYTYLLLMAFLLLNIDVNGTQEVGSAKTTSIYDRELKVVGRPYKQPTAEEKEEAQKRYERMRSTRMAPYDVNVYPEIGAVHKI